MQIAVKFWISCTMFDKIDYIGKNIGMPNRYEL